jgi:hypothetical protein
MPEFSKSIDLSELLHEWWIEYLLNQGMERGPAEVEARRKSDDQMTYIESHS